MAKTFFMRWWQRNLMPDFTTGATPHSDLGELTATCRRRNAKFGFENYWSWPVEYEVQEASAKGKNDGYKREITEHLDDIGLPPSVLRSLRERPRRGTEPRSGRG